METLPYQIIASSAFYQPDDTISVTVSGNDLFKGFFFQARDAKTQEWIGEWVESQNTKTIPECASITHADNREKTVYKFIHFSNLSNNRNISTASCFRLEGTK